jgi:hypothetical protein
MERIVFSAIYAVSVVAPFLLTWIAPEMVE